LASGNCEGGDGDCWLAKAQWSSVLK
jgi:hypothetical protein